MEKAHKSEKPSINSKEKPYSFNSAEEISKSSKKHHHGHHSRSFQKETDAVLATPFRIAAESDLRTAETYKEDLKENPTEEPSRSDDAPTPILPLIGEVIAFVSLGAVIYTLFLLLRLDGTIHWNYWIISIPLWFIFFILLLLTQSKKLTTHASLIVRLAWLICVLCMVVFLFLVDMRLQYLYDSLSDDETLNSLVFDWVYIFVPLWIFIGIDFILSVSGFLVGCFGSNSQTKERYRSASVSLLIFDLVFTPFLLLLQLKLSGNAESFGWAVVFISLFIVDVFFLVTGCVLLVFTFGSTQDAIFSLPQVIAFLLVCVLSIVFKILLIVALDKQQHGESLPISLLGILSPLIILELLLMAIGISVRVRRRPITEGYQPITASK